jgi:aldose 1-epimerase
VRAPLPPSGEQVEITYGDQRAVVVEVGGGLRSYTAGDREVIDGYGLDEMSSAGRGQVLSPWPNRLKDGRYEFGGRHHQLPPDESGRQNAIHGLVRWQAWTVGELEPHRVVMEHVLHPRPGYPFTVAMRMQYQLSDAGLLVRSTATNVGADDCPYGTGAHPYLTVGTTTVDTAVLRVPARTVLQADERGIPVGAGPVDGTDYDFRQPRPIGATVLDHAYTDLERGQDGLVRVELTDPEHGTAVALWADASYEYLMVFSGNPLPDVARRSLAVEPMTCPPNAFGSGEGVIVLEPGASVTGTWGVSPR